MMDTLYGTLAHRPMYAIVRVKYKMYITIVREPPIYIRRHELCMMLNVFAHQRASVI